MEQSFSPLKISLKRNIDNNEWNLSGSPGKKKKLNVSKSVQIKSIKKKPTKNTSQRTITLLHILYISI